MQNFKIVFPSQRMSDGVKDANTDINLYLETGEVYFATCYTPENLKWIMENNNEHYFWSVNMFVIPTMSNEAIRKGVTDLLKDGYLEDVFYKIGTIEDMDKVFAEIIDVTISS